MSFCYVGLSKGDLILLHPGRTVPTLDTQFVGFFRLPGAQFSEQTPKEHVIANTAVRRNLYSLNMRVDTLSGNYVGSMKYYHNIGFCLNLETAGK